LNIVCSWDDPADETGKTCVREFHARMQPHEAVGQHVNFLAADDRGGDPREQALAAYGPRSSPALLH
jgi:hypothetical protein